MDTSDDTSSDASCDTSDTGTESSVTLTDHHLFYSVPTPQRYRPRTLPLNRINSISKSGRTLLLLSYAKDLKLNLESVQARDKLARILNRKTLATRLWLQRWRFLCWILALWLLTILVKNWGVPRITPRISEPMDIPEAEDKSGLVDETVQFDVGSMSFWIVTDRLPTRAARVGFREKFESFCPKLGVAAWIDSSNAIPCLGEGVDVTILHLLFLSEWELATPGTLPALEWCRRQTEVRELTEYPPLEDSLNRIRIVEAVVREHLLENGPDQNEDALLFWDLIAGFADAGFIKLCAAMTRASKK